MTKLKSILALLCIVGYAYAVPTDSIFINLPENILPTLAKKQRFELAEYFKAGKKDSVANLFGRNTILQKYDTANCHIIIKTSTTGTTEIKRLLISENERIIGIINTINKPVKYSQINFYTENWQIYPLKTQLPQYSSWINEKQLLTSGINPIWVKNLMDKNYLSMFFGPSNELEYENNVLNTLSVEDKKLVEPFFENKTIAVKIVK